jgi:DNA-binding LacI/PurR family transcriptional regulator
MAGKPTLVSLARELGVSRQTVSNAINAPHRVNADTLARVRQAIADSGYRPHVAGRQLRTRRSRNLAMRLYPSSDGINGSILDRFLHALTVTAQRHGYRLTLFTADDDAAELAAIDELLSTADIDGFVVTSTHHEDARTGWLVDHEVPFVCFGRPWHVDGDPFSAPHAWVDVDGSAGTAEATELLLERGHTRIGFLGWPHGSGVGDDRRTGWERALSTAGADRDAQELSLGVEDTVASGARGARDLLERGATALVCASDSLALGALAAWRDADLPQDGSRPPVVGFDDTPVAAAVGLSSVHQPIEEVAEHSIAGLLAQLDGDTVRAEPDPSPRTRVDGTERHRLLPSRLVVRQPHPHLLPDPQPDHAETPPQKEPRR